jgi:hypothetical protein
MIRKLLIVSKEKGYLVKKTLRINFEIILF